MLKPLAPVGPPGDSHIAASLTQHLLSQNAPRAAARVSGHEPTQPEPCAYAVAPDSVTLVDTAALAARFSGMLHELLHAPATVGLDLEWRPDTLQNVHRPSLLQLATSTHVWLVDLDAAPSSTPFATVDFCRRCWPSRRRLGSLGLFLRRGSTLTDRGEEVADSHGFGRVGCTTLVAELV